MESSTAIFASVFAICMSIIVSDLSKAHVELEKIDNGLQQCKVVWFDVQNTYHTDIVWARDCSQALQIGAKN